ncbi:hypothetical protein BGX23_004673 [Mortierella sp. AD031]|nr:hypothetical protein BGX23_004673 [Mortierella sp. AD031]
MAVPRKHTSNQQSDSEDEGGFSVTSDDDVSDDDASNDGAPGGDAPVDMAYTLTIKTKRVADPVRSAKLIVKKAYMAEKGNVKDSTIQNYASRLVKWDIPGAFSMAGFYTERYDIKRDRYLPPLELQRLIFLDRGVVRAKGQGGLDCGVRPVDTEPIGESGSPDEIQGG